MRGLLVGDDARVAEWAFRAYSFRPTQFDMAIGIVDDPSRPRLLGAALFQCYNGNNVELSYYGHATLTLGLVRSLARVVVGTFNASRVTVVTAKKNKAFVRALYRLGFKFECSRKCYYGRSGNDRDTGIQLVMFRDRVDQIARITPQKVNA